MAKHLHEKRGITFQELGALLAVRALLHGNLMTFDATHNKIAEGEHRFDMSCTYKRITSCGSVGCIGGMMAFIMGHDQQGANEYVLSHGHMYMEGTTNKLPPTTLHNLFYPDDALVWERATPEKAIEAIDNWLDDGDAKWNLLLPEHDHIQQERDQLEY